ncbi:hypothetical protein X975_02370, partial [Stegodyphus mimosarum]
MAELFSKTSTVSGLKKKTTGRVAIQARHIFSFSYALQKAQRYWLKNTKGCFVEYTFFNSFQYVIIGCVLILGKRLYTFVLCTLAY